MTSPKGSSADARLKSFIDRVLRLKEEQDALATDIREVYAEAKGEGYDKTAMGQVVSHLRKVEKAGADAIAERETVFGLYLDAYQRGTGTIVATHAHEEFDPDTGELKSDEHHGSDVRAYTPAESVSDEISVPNLNSVTPPPPGETEKTGADFPLPSAPVTPIPDDDVPAFLKRERKPLRPNCLNPSNCAGYGTKTCHSCLKAAAEGEAA